MLDMKLTTDKRLIIGLAEKHFVKQEIDTLVNKSEKDIDTLKAVLEECRMRMVETKKDAYDFKRDIVVAADGTKNNKINAEKIKRYAEDKLKARGTLAEKYKIKNQSLQIQINKLQEQLKSTSDTDGNTLTYTKPHTYIFCCCFAI